MSVSRVSSMQSGSLYRKYRPQTFDELVGQELIARTLRNAVALGRVAHAYLFCGPRGTGKTSTARLLAKAVNCLEPDPWQRPCNSCSACQVIARGTALDIIEIDAASNRGVDDIRDLREKVKYAPVELHTKFYIIDEAHQLTRDAFNAFLKTLEEPPPHVVFVLATTEPDKLPETVASRCQRFDFRRLPAERVVERLRAICEQEGIVAQEEVLTLIARRATGSLRDALGLLERLVILASQDGAATGITLELAQEALGGSRQDRLLGILEALVQRNPAQALRTIAEAANAGEDLQQLGRDLTAFVRSLLYAKAGVDDPLLPPEAKLLLERFSFGELTVILRRLTGADLPLPRSGVDPQLVLELAVVESLLTLDQATSGRAMHPKSELSNDLSRVTPTRQQERRDSVLPPRSDTASLPSTPAPTGSDQTTLGAAEDSSRFKHLIMNWAKVRREIRAANSKAAAILADAEPRLIRGEEVVLISPYEFHRRRINEETALRQVIERVLARYLGFQCRIVCLTPEEVTTVSTTSTPKEADLLTESLSSPTAHQLGESNLPTSSLSPGDQQRLEAAKTIFQARELPEDS